MFPAGHGRAIVRKRRTRRLHNCARTEPHGSSVVRVELGPEFRLREFPRFDDLRRIRASTAGPLPVAGRVAGRYTDGWASSASIVQRGCRARCSRSTGDATDAGGAVNGVNGRQSDSCRADGGRVRLPIETTRISTINGIDPALGRIEPVRRPYLFSGRIFRFVDTG